MDIFKLAAKFQKYANFSDLQNSIMDWGIKWDKKIEPKYISAVMNSMAKYETNPNSDTLKHLTDILLKVTIDLDSKGYEWKFHRGDFNEISPRYFNASKELEVIRGLASGIFFGR